MEFVTQNGQKTVTINPASYENATKLKKTVLKALLDAGVIKSLDAVDSIQLSTLFDSLFSILINLDISSEFESAIFECLKGCLYESGVSKLKITKELFNDIPEAREDYYELITKCCEVNLRPFLKSLVSGLKIDLPRLINTILAL